MSNRATAKLLTIPEHLVGDSPLGIAAAEEKRDVVRFLAGDGQGIFDVWVEENERGVPVLHAKSVGHSPVAFLLHR